MQRKMGEEKRKTPTLSDEVSGVLAEYLELFDCLGYRYKYFMAPNAELDWFDTFHIRTPLRIHEFLLEKFGGRCRHANFDKALSSGPIESKESHMRIRHMPNANEGDHIIHPRNIVPELTSLKTRAESDIETEDIEMDATTAVEIATSSNRVKKSAETAESSDESDEYSIKRCKRMKYSAPQMSPFTYLRRLPTKKPQTTVISSDDESSDDDAETGNKNSRQLVNTTTTKEYSQLRYLEAVGTILKSKSRQLGGGFAERPVRLRIGYRKHLTNHTTQFALIIYERRDQKVPPIRSRRMLDFSKCIEDDEHQEADDLDCIDAQPAVIRSNDGGEEREMIATVETPTSAEIATALEEAAFTIQPPIQRTPTKATPIPPGTPKRRPRSTQQLNMSGLVPLSMTPVKRLNATPGTTPKLSAARSLRL